MAKKQQIEPDNSALSWNIRYKKVKKEFKLTNFDIASMAEVTVGNIRNITKPSKAFPNLLKPTIIILEAIRGLGINIKKNNND